MAQYTLELLYEDLRRDISEDTAKINKTVLKISYLKSQNFGRWTEEALELNGKMISEVFLVQMRIGFLTFISELHAKYESDPTLIIATLPYLYAITKL